MDIIKFFEKLATHSHHKINLNSLINELSIEIQTAYLINDSELLKSLLAANTYLANESHVIQIHKNI